MILSPRSLSDILAYRLEVYGQEADELIRKIAELSSRRELNEWWEKEIDWSTEHDLVLRKARISFDELFERTKRSGWETK